ncbi:MAG: hypothetical protein AAF216_08240 [Pseudomonadota bacterium]
MVRAFGLFIALWALAACGDSAPVSALTESATLDIAPTDFALVRCSETAESVPCLVIHAGGKSVLIGAPAGALASLQRQGIEVPDMVLLPDLMPSSLNGLVELRNQTWQAGRLGPLPVIGPVGTREVTAHLNAAFVIPDAERFAVKPPPGGFEAALIAGADAPPAEGFDTGDLKVLAVPSPTGTLTFHVEYGGRRLVLGTCDSSDQPVADLVVSMVCDGAMRSYDWPFETPMTKISTMIE